MSENYFWGCFIVQKFYMAELESDAWHWKHYSYKQYLWHSFRAIANRE